ncbi:MAG: long-chain fatty acid--CoA ligase [Candidatus Sericytochromatia bacterium]
MAKLVISEIFIETAKKNENKKALGKKDSSGEYKYITYKELHEKVNCFASAMIEMGMKSHDKLALMSENSPEWVITDLGDMFSNVLNVPIYPTLTYPQLEYILNNCGARGIVVSNNTHYQKVVKIFDSVPTLEFVVYVDKVEKVEHEKVKTYSFDEILEKGKNALNKNLPEIEKRISETQEDDVCSIIYTSGTTGDPKGVMLTNKNFMSNSVESAKILLPKSVDALELSFLPLSHVLERVVYYAIVVVIGGKVAYAESIDAISKNLLEVKPTILVSVPRIYEKIYNKVMEGVNASPPLKKNIFKWALNTGKEYYEANKYGHSLSFILEMEYKLAEKLVFNKIREKTGGNLQVLVSGGAPLMKELAEFFAYIGLPIQEGYGLTETSPVIAFNRKHNIKFGTVGQMIPDVSVKIAEDGEILAKGPNIMKGYYNNPVATAEVIDKEGWFHTGDIGELDSENFLKITDRKKELIIMSNGKNVAPQPIENLLKTSIFIEQVATIGDNRKYMSALIVPNYEELRKKLGITLSNQELCKDQKVMDFMMSEVKAITKDKLAKFEELKKITLLPREFTLENNEITPTLKLKRKIISKNFKEEIEAMYPEEHVKAEA